jgi:prepilin-type N-terminal cleavage/methylation domain-containing protein
MNRIYKNKADFFSRGFTLIEIILVVIILTVVTGLTVPNFSKTYKKFLLKTATDEIAFIMRYAQSRAVTKNRQVRFEFDPEFQKYWLTQEVLSDDENTENKNFERFTGKNGGNYEVYRDCKVEVDDNKVDFFSDGTIEKKHIYVCNDKNCYTISTKEQRGYIQVYDTKVESENEQ